MRVRLGLAAALALLYGCSANQSDVELLQELSETTPELQIEEPHYTFIRNSARIVRLSARSAELFGANNIQKFTDVAFIELDRNNNTLNSGSADNAIHFVNSGNFELTGNVVFQSLEQNATVNAQYILWDNEQQKLFGREGEMVTVTRPSGTRIEGSNLNADLAARVIEFDSASGVIFPGDIQDNGTAQNGNAGTNDDVAAQQR